MKMANVFLNNFTNLYGFDCFSFSISPIDSAFGDISAAKENLCLRDWDLRVAGISCNSSYDEVC